MKLLKILAPRIAALLSALIVHFVPRLEGAEQAVTSAILAVWGLYEIYDASSRAKRQELVERDQRTLRAEGLYHGKLDGKYGPVTSTAVQRSIHGGRP